MNELSLIAFMAGDPSVGIPSATFTIDHIFLEDAEHRTVVRRKFATAFEVLTGEPVKIVFTDELPS